MIKYDLNEYCCGCGACENACPMKAIKMINGEGEFLFPQIDKDKCIKCGICVNICPHLNAKKLSENNFDVLGTWLYASSDSEAKKRSASGSAFYELAKYYVDSGDFVCGCTWDKDLKAVHTLTDTLKGVHRMQGSKYVQSNVNACYSQVVEKLISGKSVLFSGTPCQVVAMHNMVMNIEKGKFRNKLLNVAVICHGIATPGGWESYKKWTSEKHNSKLVDVNFRDKSQEGYKKSYCRYEYATGEVNYQPTYLPSSKYIESSLVYNLAIRNSCSHCNCKGVNIGCDIILGDWYDEYKGLGELGTSCIVAFTQRGYELVNSVLTNLRKFDYAKVKEKNSFIENSVTLGQKRNDYLEHMDDENFWENVEQYYPPKYKYKKLLVKIGVYNLIKKFM